jgi:hypothetical protein
MIKDAPSKNPVINDPPLPTSNHEWEMNERKITPKLDLDSKETQTNLPPLMRLQ